MLIKLWIKIRTLRGLRTILENILLDTMFNLPGVEGVDEIVVNGEVVQKNVKPLYIYNKSNKVYNKKGIMTDYKDSLCVLPLRDIVVFS